MPGWNVLRRWRRRILSCTLKAVSQVPGRSERGRIRVLHDLDAVDGRENAAVTEAAEQTLRARNRGEGTGRIRETRQIVQARQRLFYREPECDAP